MEQEKKKLYTVVAVVALAALLLSCIIGALAGGIAGIVTGRRQARLAMERVLERDLGSLPGIQEGIPWPCCQGLPFVEPQPGEEFPPSEIVPPGMAGAIISEVIPATPAAEAGLKVGDLITAIDRTPVDASHPLPDVIGQYQPGDRITLHFWRAGQENTVRVELAEHPEKTGQAYLGVKFEMIEKRDVENP